MIHAKLHTTLGTLLLGSLLVSAPALAKGNVRAHAASLYRVTQITSRDVTLAQNPSRANGGMIRVQTPENGRQVLIPNPDAQRQVLLPNPDAQRQVLLPNPDAQ